MLDIKGSFRVNKMRMIQSNIQYAVLFLKDRLVFVKVGGQFADGGLAGAVAGGAIGGALGGLIGSTIEQKLQKAAIAKKNEKIRSLGEMSVSELIETDKDNFEILYVDITKIEIKKSSLSLNGTRTGVLKIEGKKKETFDIAPNQKFEECQQVINSLLSDKVIAA